MDRLWAMEVFVRVVESRSFSGAAASLDVANATVTACIRNLEQHLGITLIQRTTRHLRLTSEGEEFLAHAQEILQRVAEAETSIKAMTDQMNGLIRVEVPIGIGHALICPALTHFARCYPQTSVAITLTNQPHSMIEQAIDVAIRMDRVEDADLVARLIYEARYVICGTAEIVSRCTPDPGDLDARLCLGLLAENRSRPVDWSLSNNVHTATVCPAGPLSFNSSDALIQASLDGVGLICVLDVFANRFLASGELVEAYADWTTWTKAFYAVTPKRRAPSLKVSTFINFLLKTLDSQRRLDLHAPVKVGASQDRR